MMEQELIHRGPINATTYHADDLDELAGFEVDPSLSSTLAGVLVNQSPLHAHATHPRLGGDAPRVESKTFDTGTLAHVLLLEAPGAPEIWTIEADSFRTKASKEARDEALANGAIPVLTKDLEVASVACERIRERLREQWGIELHKGRREEAIVYRENIAAPGEEPRIVTCRSMLDCVQGLDVYDLKTTRSAHPDDAAKSVGNYGYAIQRAAYTGALAAAEEEAEGRVSFRFVFVEMAAPYAVGVYDLDGVYREHGERQWSRAKTIWEECRRTDKWPGYDTATRLVAPPWILKA